MATTTYKRCPHCRVVYETYSTYTKSLNDHTGTPFRKCPNCGKSFVDDDFKEPALEPYKEESYSVLRVLLSLIFPLGFWCIALSAFAIFESEYRIITSILSVVSWFLYIFLAVRVSKKKQEFQKQDREKYEESLKRLSNPQYAQALKDIGVAVPDKFLPLESTQLPATRFASSPLDSMIGSNPLIKEAYKAYMSTDPRIRLAFSSLRKTSELKKAFLEECENLKNQEESGLDISHEDSYYEFMSILAKDYS